MRTCASCERSSSRSPPPASSPASSHIATIEAVSRTPRAASTGAPSASSTSHARCVVAAERDEVERAARARLGREHAATTAAVRGRRPPRSAPGRRSAPRATRVEPVDAARRSSRRSARRYDRWRSVLSFGQDPRWRRFLVSRIDAGPATRCSTSRPAPARSRSSSCARRTATSSGSTRAPEMLEEARGGWRSQRRASSSLRGRRARAAVRGRRSSTRSRSPTCSATSTTRRRRCASSRASCKPGGTIAGLEFGVPRGSGGRSGSLGARRPPGRRAADRRRLARGRRVPRPVDPRALRRSGPLPRLLAAWRDAGHRATCRRGGSASAAEW